MCRGVLRARARGDLHHCPLHLQDDTCLGGRGEACQDVGFRDGGEDTLVDGVASQALIRVAPGMFSKPAHEKGHHVGVGWEGGLVMKCAELGELAPVRVVGGTGATGLV